MYLPERFCWTMSATHLAIQKHSDKRWFAANELPHLLADLTVLTRSSTLSTLRLLSCSGNYLGSFCFRCRGIYTLLRRCNRFPCEEIIFSAGDKVAVATYPAFSISADAKSSSTVTWNLSFLLGIIVVTTSDATYDFLFGWPIGVCSWCFSSTTLLFGEMSDA